MRTLTVLFWLLEEPGGQNRSSRVERCVQPYNGGSKLKIVRELPCNSRNVRPRRPERYDIDRRTYFHKRSCVLSGAAVWRRAYAESPVSGTRVYPQFRAKSEFV